MASSKGSVVLRYVLKCLRPSTYSWPSGLLMSPQPKYVRLVMMPGKVQRPESAFYFSFITSIHI